MPSIAAALALCAVATASTEVQAAMVFKDQPVDRLAYRWVSLPPGATVTFETTDLSAGADTVLHLWSFTELEVAQDDDSGSEAGASYLSWTNTTGSTKYYYLVMRAQDAGSHGTARLLQNGGSIGVWPVGGLLLDVEGGWGREHEVVAAPNGPDYLSGVGLDANGHMVELDFYGGVGYGARLDSPLIDRVVIGTTVGATGPVHVYTNDIDDDADGDGLGPLLESELGTCDDALTGYCVGVHNLADSDRDGLPDGAEVFGIEAGVDSQYLPKWGADPLHKDVFVELDYRDDFASNPVLESDVQWAEDRYAPGSAEDLQNPDGLPGVRLHFDIDKPCPSDPALCGDWGGSSQVPPGIAYDYAANDHRDPARVGVFVYALMYLGGGGQARWSPGDRFQWGGSTSNRGMGSFVHELGHSVGLGHYGHSSWGTANGKANYRSLMNYVPSGGEFSLGESSVVLDPSNVDESVGIDGDPSSIEAYPWNREVGLDEEVDWDFDLTYSGGGADAIRAPLTYATAVGTSALMQNREPIHTEDDLAAATPALVRGHDDRLYAFYIDDHRIYYRRALMDGPLQDGACPGGGDLGDDCTEWSEPIEVPTTHDAAGLSVVFEESAYVLAYRTTGNQLRLYRAYGSSSGSLYTYGNELYLGSTDADPEVEPMRVDPSHFGGDDHVTAIFYRSTVGGQYRWRTLSSAWSGYSTYRGVLLDEVGAQISGTQGPSFTSWPYDPHTSTTGTSCGALTGTDGRVRMYCYDPGTDRFERMFAFEAAGPFSAGKPGLAYRTQRSHAGMPKDGDESRGAFWLTVTAEAATYDVVQVWISDPVSENSQESLYDLAFPTDNAGLFGNVWTNVADGSGVALYDDPVLGSLKALAVLDSNGDHVDHTRHVYFMPFADGTFGAELRDGNDFRVMERALCDAIKPSSYCGPSSWGLD